MDQTRNNLGAGVAFAVTAVTVIAFIGGAIIALAGDLRG